MSMPLSTGLYDPYSRNLSQKIQSHLDNLRKAPIRFEIRSKGPLGSSDQIGLLSQGGKVALSKALFLLLHGKWPAGFPSCSKLYDYGVALRNYVELVILERKINAPPGAVEAQVNGICQEQYRAVITPYEWEATVQLFNLHVTIAVELSKEQKELLNFPAKFASGSNMQLGLSTKASVSHPILSTDLDTQAEPSKRLLSILKAQWPKHFNSFNGFYRYELLLKCFLELLVPKKTRRSMGSISREFGKSLACIQVESLLSDDDWGFLTNQFYKHVIIMQHLIFNRVSNLGDTADFASQPSLSRKANLPKWLLKFNSDVEISDQLFTLLHNELPAEFPYQGSSFKYGLVILSYVEYIIFNRKAGSPAKTILSLTPEIASVRARWGISFHYWLHILDKLSGHVRPTSLTSSQKNNLRTKQKKRWCRQCQ